MGAHEDFFNWLSSKLDLSLSDAKTIDYYINELRGTPPLSEFKERRLKLGMSMEKIQRATGVHPATISRLETGKNSTTIGNVRKLDAFYKKHNV